MTVKQRTSLGRNLSALLSQSTLLQEKPAQSDNFTHLAIQSLQPSQYQPRRDINEATLAELAASIKQQGVLQPLLVRQIDPDHYEILAGERRWRAAQLAELNEIPVIIKEVDNETAMAIALVENLQREDLSALDQAHAMQRLITEFDLTHQQVADLLGKSRTAVSNHLRLLSLTDAVKHFLENEEIDMGHARALLTLSPDQQIQVATLIIAEDLSVRETEQLIQRLNKNATISSQPLEASPNKEPFGEYTNRLTQQLKTTVRIQQNSSGKGKVIIHFDSSAKLEKIIAEINGGKSM